MSTPIDERGEPSYSLPPYNVNKVNSNERSSDEEGTVIGQEEAPFRNASHSISSNNGQSQDRNHLKVDTADYTGDDPLKSMQSPSQTREQAHRLDDDLALLHVERQVSIAAAKEEEDGELSRTRSMHRSRSRREDMVDDFDVATNPIHEKAAVYKPPEHPVGNFSKFVKRVHSSSFLVRYFTYIVPLVFILLIPLLLGALVFKNSTVGGVTLMWFSIWLEIVWLTLWAGRILAKMLPWPIGLISSLFTNNSKKWRDMGKQLELPATLFFWWLGIEISFLPTMIHHHVPYNTNTRDWEVTMNKVIVSVFVGAVLNFVEKIIIQLIAISFHLRTYQDRIELNKFQIGSLTKLYSFSKEKIAMEDSEFEAPSGPGSGTRTPAAQYLDKAQKQTREVFSKFGDVAGKIAGDFTGKQVAKSTHPHQVILTLLGTTGGSQVLARRLYRTFAREETETVYSDDLKNAFENNDEAEAAFSMFDKDMNGDISMEELEAVCVEIGRERKAITASLKDLDSVVGKLDDVFMFVVFLITMLVFISLISTSAAGVLTSAGSTVLALSWLFSATAQEFLQSCIFVFVKHPFDVGDRVSIYGNTGPLGRGDDYFVKEIALLYTEFKKMEGHVVQASNSYLNTLFILNQRRSGGLAEAVPITVKFGTTLDQIDTLRQRLLEFVKSEKREFQGNILTEVRDVVEVHALNINVVFFYKSNWQNEGLRLARRNKFICAMMVTMQELGIEGPRMRYPGQKESFPLYMQNLPHMPTPGVGHNGHPDNPAGWQSSNDNMRDPAFVPNAGDQDQRQQVQQPQQSQPVSATSGNASMNRQTSVGRHPSILHNGSVLGRRPRNRGESLSQMHRRVDFSLGMKDIASGNECGDVFVDEENRPRIPIEVTSPSTSRHRSSHDSASEDVGRSTSRASDTFAPGNRLLSRVRTDDSDSRLRSRGSVHRNRFFGCHRAAGDETDRMESGMADIPENENSVSAGPSPRIDNGTADSIDIDTRTDGTTGGNLKGRLDPRTDEENVKPEPPVASGALGPMPFEDRAPEGHRVLGAGAKRSQTEDWEMRRFR
ncbi:Mechanosensitive ion channel-domain-containing protein [Cryomyces antarcticus]